MVTKRVFQSLSAITLGRHKMNDPRYEFLTEEKNGEVVSCIVNNAEIKDVPGIDYELSINPDNPDKIDALQIIINDESKKLGDVFMQLPYGVLRRTFPASVLQRWRCVRRTTVSLCVPPKLWHMRNI